MTARVYLKPNGRVVAVPFQRLGETAKGTWGLVEDGTWIGRPDGAALELLYFNEADYRHAMRRLPAREIALAIEHRRKVFWEPLPSDACGWVQEVMWRCMERTEGDELGLRLRRGLLTLHAKLADVDRLVGDSTEEQLHWLFTLDSELIDDLECPSLQQVYPVDTDGKERAFRQHLLAELVRLQKNREMRPGDRLLMSIYRGYAVGPVSGELRRQARQSHRPSMQWRDRLLMGLTDWGVSKLRGHQVRLIYARPTQLLEAEELTEAQFDVEIEDRLAGPDLYPYFSACRIGLASTREAVRLLNPRKPDVQRVLSKQVEDELLGLSRFRRPPRPTPTLDDLLNDLLAVIDLLAAIVLRRAGLTAAARLKSLGRDVRKLMKGDEP